MPGVQVIPYSLQCFVVFEAIVKVRDQSHNLQTVPECNVRKYLWSGPWSSTISFITMSLEQHFGIVKQASSCLNTDSCKLMNHCPLKAWFFDLLWMHLMTNLHDSFSHLRDTPKLMSKRHHFYEALLDMQWKKQLRDTTKLASKSIVFTEFYLFGTQSVQCLHVWTHLPQSDSVRTVPCSPLPGHLC